MAKLPEFFHFQVRSGLTKIEIQDVSDKDFVEVVRCLYCINYVESEEVNGEKMCVRDADWSVEDGCYYGFTEYTPPDWFCADGKKREES